MDQDFYSKNYPLFRVILDPLVHCYRSQFMIHEYALGVTKTVVNKYGSQIMIHELPLDF